jgi:hypothetical protein
MFQMLALFAEFERSMIRDRVVSGMARARITSTKSGRAIGRPAVTDVNRDVICGLLGAGQSERAIVRQLGVSKGAEGRVRAWTQGGLSVTHPYCTRVAIFGPASSGRRFRVLRASRGSGAALGFGGGGSRRGQPLTHGERRWEFVSDL